jgi:hypothetical protein
MQCKITADVQLSGQKWPMAKEHKILLYLCHQQIFWLPQKVSHLYILYDKKKIQKFSVKEQYGKSTIAHFHL